jgi:hypothetical protein
MSLCAERNSQIPAVIGTVWNVGGTAVWDKQADAGQSTHTLAITSQATEHSKKLNRIQALQQCGDPPHSHLIEKQLKVVCNP